MRNSLKLFIVFPVNAKELYKAWLDSDTHSAFTGSPAKIDPVKGGKFTTWDGYISGPTIELVPGRKIIQTWRSTDFDAKDPDSTLEIQFEQHDRGSARLTILHSNLPERLLEELRKGWKDFYFQPMKEYFGT